MILPRSKNVIKHTFNILCNALLILFRHIYFSRLCYLFLKNEITIRFSHLKYCHGFLLFLHRKTPSALENAEIKIKMRHSCEQERIKMTHTFQRLLSHARGKFTCSLACIHVQITCSLEDVTLDLRFKGLLLLSVQIFTVARQGFLRTSQSRKNNRRSVIKKKTNKKTTPLRLQRTLTTVVGV